MNKEHPIIFSTPMVKAILDDRKTQTRRVIKPQPIEVINKRGNTEYHCLTKPRSGYSSISEMKDFLPIYCPYGQVGNKLWVRETFLWDRKNEHCIYMNGKQPFQVYKNDSRDSQQLIKDGILAKISAIFMPRWASRILLEIVKVRVEQIADISVEDVIAEGIEKIDTDTNKIYSDTRIIIEFAELWNSINSKRGFVWNLPFSNPWVWVIEFRRCDL